MAELAIILLDLTIISSLLEQIFGFGYYFTWVDYYLGRVGYYPFEFDYYFISAGANFWLWLLFYLG
ncbi:hypothetical protein [Ureibacillus thermosphaericus]|uniref:hypothetical protein n=1 Tax=Ureibacillus thermosphaericus TaxID=51173 RepID=UPI0030EB151A